MKEDFTQEELLSIKMKAWKMEDVVVNPEWKYAYKELCMAAGRVLDMIKISTETKPEIPESTSKENVQ